MCQLLAGQVWTTSDHLQSWHSMHLLDWSLDSAWCVCWLALTQLFVSGLSPLHALGLSCSRFNLRPPVLGLNGSSPRLHDARHFYSLQGSLRASLSADLSLVWFGVTCQVFTCMSVLGHTCIQALCPGILEAKIKVCLL